MDLVEEYLAKHNFHPSKHMSYSGSEVFRPKPVEPGIVNEATDDQPIQSVDELNPNQARVTKPQLAWIKTNDRFAWRGMSEEEYQNLLADKVTYPASLESKDPVRGAWFGKLPSVSASYGDYVVEFEGAKPTNWGGVDKPLTRKNIRRVWHKDPATATFRLITHK